MKIVGYPLTISNPKSQDKANGDNLGLVAHGWDGRDADHSPLESPVEGKPKCFENPGSIDGSS